MLIDSAPTAVHGWLLAALADPTLDLGKMPRGGAAVEAFLRAVGGQAGSGQTISGASISVFQAVAGDFSRACRGKMRAS